MTINEERVFSIMDKELHKVICQSILIVRGLSRAIENSWDEFGRKNGISSAHQHILYLLWHKNELTISGLAEMGIWHISTVTRLLRSLINDGMVETYDNLQDGRSVYVRLTDKGHELIENLYSEAMNDPNFLPFVRKLWETDPDFLKDSIQQGLHKLEMVQGKPYTDWVRSLETE